MSEPIGVTAALAEIQKRNAPEKNLSGGVESRHAESSASVHSNTHELTTPALSQSRSGTCAPPAQNTVNAAGVKPVEDTLSKRPAASQPTPARYLYSDKNGEHLHTLDGKPLIGTSTACQVLAKPLTWWASGMALTPLGWLNTRKSNADERKIAASVALKMLATMTPAEYAKKLEECYRAHDTAKKKAAGPGVDMHAALQSYVETCIYDNAGEPLEPQGLDDHAAVITFAEWAINNVREFLWAEAHCYSERLWTGGICDCGAVLTAGGLGIIDFKSSREAYFSQFVQAGGYAAQIQENGLFRADGAPISTAMRHVAARALIIFPFGGKCEPKTMFNVEEFKKAFESAVVLHKLQTQYDA